jgi:MarR family transcriptional regulator, organic hydroperoxide resistance regulator
MPANRLPADAQNAALRLDNQLCFAMYSTSLAMTKLYKPLLETLDLTYPQYLAMLALWEQDGVSVSALGERLFLDSGTLTPLLKRMEEKGLLRRQRSAQDERRVEVFLSLQGTDLKSQAARIPACVFAATHCALPDLVALTRQVQALRKQLTEPLPLNTP